MKKIILVLLSVCLIFCVCGCSSKDTTSKPNIETQYYNYAKECIENKDTEKAKQVLEEGVEKTGSEKLKELLESLDTKSKEDTSAVDTESNVSDNTSSTESSNTQSVTESSSSQTTTPTQTESKPSIVPLANTYWCQYDSFTEQISNLHFKSENVLEYDFGNTGGFYDYDYQYNGKQLVVKYYLESDEAYYTDTYYIKFISLADNTKITARTDKIQLEGSGFLAGYWDCDGFN